MYKMYHLGTTYMISLLYSFHIPDFKTSKVYIIIYFSNRKLLTTRKGHKTSNPSDKQKTWISPGHYISNCGCGRFQQLSSSLLLTCFDRGMKMECARIALEKVAVNLKYY